MSFILDLVLVFIFLVFFMLMAKKGFVKSVHSLLGNILAVILSIILVSPATELVLKTPVGDMVNQKVSTVVESVGIDALEKSIPILSHINLEEATHDAFSSVTLFVMKIITMILLFFVMKLLVMILFKFIGAIFKIPVLSQLNFIAGGAIGLLNAALIVYIICAVMSLNLASAPDMAENIEKTMLLKHFYNNNILLNLFI